MLSFKRPVNMLVLINILSFGLLFFYREPLDYNVLYVGGAITVLTVLTYSIIYFAHLGDEYLFIIVSMLVTLGVVMLCRLNYMLGIKQVGWYLIAICAFYITFALYRYTKNLEGLKWIYFGAGVALFLITLIFGKSVGGARNWLVIMGRTFQPSELIKIIFVLFLSCYFSGDRNKKIFNINERYIIAAAAYVYIGFLVIQREWGISLLFFITYIILTYIFDFDWLLLLINGLFIMIGGTIGALTLYHIKVRISTWLNPWSDIANKGYQITQSLFAIAAGGFFGRGIGLGSPQLIPEVHSDFIFSAICEEMGIFGGIAIILLYFIFVYRGIKIALLLPDGYDKCVATGITVIFAIQTFIIIGGVIKLIPLTGITLPFVSYGGSSLVTCFMALGILQAISSKKQVNA